MLWGGETWTFGQAEAARLQAAVHEMVAQILGLRRRPAELWLDWHRRRIRAARWALWAWAGCDALATVLK